MLAYRKCMVRECRFLPRVWAALSRICCRVEQILLFLALIWLFGPDLACDRAAFDVLADTIIERKPAIYIFNERVANS